jgi:kinesin family protein C2/C3
MTSKKESIKVFVRVRPPIMDEISENAAVHVSNRNNITLYSEKHNFSCGFDCVFDETSSQAEIFQEVKPLLKDALRGENMCIFAYGQTNSGKSYTMIGPDGGQKKSDGNSHGLIPRISQYLINSLRRKLDNSKICYFQVKVSFLQIYNEVLIDLLRDNNIAAKDDEKEESLKIREIPRSRNNPGGEVYVAGLSEFRVQTVEDIMKIIKIGNSNRITNNSYYNNNSSRSHAILQLFFEIERYADGSYDDDDNSDNEYGKYTFNIN